MTTIGAIPSLPATSGIASTTPSTATPATGATSGTDFGNVLGDVVDNLSATQNTANSAALQAVTSGNLDDIQSATLAATRAQVTMELVSAVRNKGVDAFNQIMNMQA